MLRIKMFTIFGVSIVLCFIDSSVFVCFTAIALLQDKAPGTFVIRDSQSYTGAFGLAVKVEVPPMHVIQNQNKDFGKLYIGGGSQGYNLGQVFWS